MTTKIRTKGRFLLILLAMSLVMGPALTGLAVHAANSPYPGRLKGDVNDDGNIDLFDLIAIRDHIFGKITLEGDALEAADVNGDVLINIFDVMLIRDHIFGRITLS